MQRLFEQFIPEHYNLHWDLSHIKQDRIVNGRVTIRGEALSSDIQLHAKGLDISSVSVNNKQIDNFTVSDDILTISSSKSGTVVIEISFSLTVKDSMHGIYPCYYKIDSETKELYATQFESHHAREAFPCIDEPEAKATFDITIVSDEPTALSNMPVKAVDGASIAFETTPRMSTYLVAFVVGDLQHKTAKTTNDVEVNVYATKAQPAESLDWALDHAVKTIEFFDEYFDVPYPLPKSDHVALPDFSSGAMENWGLITYRETALLANPKTTSIDAKQYIATVIAHELSHQWFGNLVTMKWWNDLWLNESFATLMEYIAVDSLHPDWRVWSEFATNEGVAALRRDSIDGVQPVEVEVTHPNEISSLFDGAIVYAKGGRLLRMMQDWVGDDAFRAGLKQYFTKFAYRNTVGNDLWQAIAEASGKDVVGMMSTWITQPGFPLVRASLEGDQLTLSQERCVVGPHQPSDQLWPIPLDANHKQLPEILADKSVSVKITISGPLLINQDNNGHFVTLYDQKLRDAIVSSIRNGGLNDTQRSQFLQEQTLLARGGYLSCAELVPLLAAYENETSEKVWNVMGLALGELKKFVETDQVAEKNLRSLAGRLAGKQYKRLGWETVSNEPETDTRLRSTVIGFVLYSEDTEVIARAQELYDNNSPEALDPELRSLIMGTAVRHGDTRRNVEQLLEIYRQTNIVDLRSDITSAVTSARDHEVSQKLIELLTDTDTVRLQDLLYWYVDLLRNRESRDATWQWLRNNWQWIEERFGSDKSYDYFPRYSASILNKRSQLEEYRKFFTPLRDEPALTRTIDVGLLDLEGRISLIERDANSVAEALAKL